MTQVEIFPPGVVLNQGKEPEMSEEELRREALRQAVVAHSRDTSPQRVTETAQAFFDFLNTPVEATPTP